VKVLIGIAEILGDGLRYHHRFAAVFVPQCGGDEGATQLKLKLKTRINRSDAETIRHGLGLLSAKGSVRKAGDEFVAEAEMEGSSARELNRTFLSALRKVEKRTTLRAEWTSDDGTSERFVDYVTLSHLRQGR
jgi:hypothetical protein